MALDAAKYQVVGNAKATLLLAWIRALLVKSAIMANVNPKNVMILVFLLAKMANANPSCVQISATCAIMANVNPSVQILVLLLAASMATV